MRKFNSFQTRLENLPVLNNLIYTFLNFPCLFDFLKYDENTMIYSSILNINIFVDALTLVLVYEKICGIIIIPLVISTQITKKK